MRAAAPRKRKEANCRVLKCSHYSVIRIVWFCVEGGLGHYWLTAKGVMQTYLAVDAGGCPLEAALCGCQFRAVLFQGDAVLATAIQYAGRAHQCTSLLEVEEKALGVPFLLGFTKPNLL